MKNQGKSSPEEMRKWFADNAKYRSLAASAKQSTFARAFNDPNIVGLAYGRREAHGEKTEQPALVVYVGKKTSRKFLPPSRLLPRKVHVGGDCIEVDVVETGFFYASAFTARERPAPSGISVGNANSPSAGTLGCLVLDNTDGSLNILSNNHVLARHNAAAVGESIVQPGIFDGGSNPADQIATLNRFVTINATGSTVDGAIARVNNVGDVVDQMKDNLMPVASPDHPAVGLHFAGSCSRSLMNPIADVLNQLNIRFPNTAAGATQPISAARVGMNVEKVGRTTEYTTSTVQEIDVTVSLNYNFGTATLDNQIATAWMGDQGDSGSLVCQGGEGGSENQCGGCDSSSEASATLNRNLDTETRLAKDLRDNYLRHTKIGRWAINLFYLNEEPMQDRFRQTKLDEGDVEFARKLFDKYREEARCAAASPDSTQATLTEGHLREAMQGLKRAEPYLTDRENEAAHRLLKIARERIVGQGPREVLNTLQDEKLLEELQDIADSVPTLITKDCGC